MSGLFQQVMYHIGIDQVKSSGYHQGAHEQFHQTLKNMLYTDILCQHREAMGQRYTSSVICCLRSSTRFSGFKGERRDITFNYSSQM